MQKSLVRLLVGWLMMLAGGCLLVESGLVDLRTTSRAVQAVLAVSGLVLTVTGVILRRTATRRTQP